MKFFSLLRYKANQPEPGIHQPFLDGAGENNTLPDTATVKVICWPGGYYDSPVGGNFIPSSLVNTAKNYALRRNVYRPTPGHMAIQVKVPASDTAAAQEYYLSIGPDKNPLRTAKDVKGAVVGPLTSEPVIYGDTLAGELKDFEKQGRTATIKSVTFADATRLKNFIIKFNCVNDHIKYINEAQASIAATLPPQQPGRLTIARALEYIQEAQAAYDNAIHAVNAAKIAATSLHQTGFISLNDLNKIDRSANNIQLIGHDMKQLEGQLLNMIRKNHGNTLLTDAMQQELERVNATLQKSITVAKDAAGKDAYYSLMSGGLTAPQGHSCVSIFSDALCYGDIDGDFRQKINSRRTLPTPAVFSSLVPGNIEQNQTSDASRRRRRS